MRAWRCPGSTPYVNFERKPVRYAPRRWVRAPAASWRRQLVALRVVEEESLNSVRLLGGERTARRVFRFGQRISGDLVPTIPARFRGGPGSPSGWLVAIRLRPATGDAWIRLRAGRALRRRTIRTLPLNDGQNPAPTPDSIELRGGFQVQCQDGYVGRLVGVTYDARAGVILDLLVRVRESIAAGISSSRDPLASLQQDAGREVLVSPAWAVSTWRAAPSVPLFPATTALLLNASAEQVASSTKVRTDGALVADLWDLWNRNPALSAYLSQLEAEAHDGAVTLHGTVPTPRQRATAEQDAWHVEGILSVRNVIRVRDDSSDTR
jgi:hypothetical protein